MDDQRVHQGAEERRMIQQYEHVVVRPGTYPALTAESYTADTPTEGAVVEILGEQDLFLVDIGSSTADWDTLTVTRGDIIG